MRGRRKTRLRTNMAHVFWHNLQKVMLLTPGYGNCRAVETVENELQFSTVPTALGKLGKTHRAEFSTVPTASAAGYRYEEKTKTPSRRAKQNRMDKMQAKA